MSHSTFSFALIGVVPAVCDAEAGEASWLPADDSLRESGPDCSLPDRRHLKAPAVIVQDRYDFIALSGAF
jgi:hypothetical protein